jgi:hypothetical protein
MHGAKRSNARAHNQIKASTQVESQICFNQMGRRTTAGLETCRGVQVMTPTSFPPSPIWCLNAAFPTSQVQTRSCDCSTRAHGPRSEHNPKHSPASFHPFFPSFGALGQQFARDFAEIALAVPSWLFGTASLSTRLLPPRRFSAYRIRHRHPRSGAFEA